MDQFREGMRGEGFVEGDDYTLDVRAAGSSTELLVPLARELVALEPALILAVTTGSTQAARAVTSAVPIVMVAAHDPVEAGVVTSLSHPGGNVTGQSLMGGDLMPKQLELLAEIAPLKRIAYLSPHLASPAPGYVSVTDTFERSMREKAGARGIDVRALKWSEPAELVTLLTALNAEGVDAIFMIESSTWFTPPAPRPLDRVVEVAIRRRLPSISGARGYADAGLLMTYGSVVGPDNWRTVTRFVARILRGAKTADIPVERPTRFELVVNSKTASALGVTLPQALLDRADVVIR